jgi:hypothetical protein
MKAQHYKKQPASLPSNSVAIGNGTPWANPFKQVIDGGKYTAEESLRLYRQYIEIKLEEGAAALQPLYRKTLACTCPGGAGCHGQVLLQLIEEEQKALPPYNDMLETLLDFTRSLTHEQLAALYRRITPPQFWSEEDELENEELETQILKDKLAQRNLVEIVLLYAEARTKTPEAARALTTQAFNYIFDIEEAIDKFDTPTA